MSFKAISTRSRPLTGLSIAQVKARAEAAGLIHDDRTATGTKATQVTDWLKSEFGLGHGHAMSAYAWFSGKLS